MLCLVRVFSTAWFVKAIGSLHAGLLTTCLFSNGISYYVKLLILISSTSFTIVLSL